MKVAGLTWESEREGVVGNNYDGIGRAGRGRQGGIPSGVRESLAQWCY